MKMNLRGKFFLYINLWIKINAISDTDLYDFPHCSPIYPYCILISYEIRRKTKACIN